MPPLARAQTRSMRRERDSLGEELVPDRALYGIFTQRARETFDLSGLRPHPEFIRAIALIKKAKINVVANPCTMMVSGMAARPPMGRGVTRIKEIVRAGVNYKFGTY